jgi:hypothetical protein
MNCIGNNPRRQGPYTEIRADITPIITKIREACQTCPPEVDSALSEVAALLEAAEGQLQSLEA